MITQESILLMATAASVGFVHTIMGPDHYLPFIALAKSRQWRFLKTMRITAVCGLGHVFGSIVIGVVGMLFAVALLDLQALESLRGDIAAWMLIIFGFTYFAWGLHKSMRRRFQNQSGQNELPVEKTTAFSLFIIFVLGPCEALIPLMMYPAAKQQMLTAGLVTLTFSLATVFTMLATVAAGAWGFQKIRSRTFEMYAHPISGFIIFSCGIAVKFGL